MKDSLYNAYMNRPPRTIEIIKKETNWIVTGAITVLTILANWAIYLAIQK